MTTPSTYRDVYFIAVEDQGIEHLFCLYAHLSSRPSVQGHFLAYLLAPDSEEILFYDCADDLKTLRAQLDDAIGRAGKLVLCYRDRPYFPFEWYLDAG